MLHSAQQCNKSRQPHMYSVNAEHIQAGASGQNGHDIDKMVVCLGQVSDSMSIAIVLLPCIAKERRLALNEQSGDEEPGEERTAAMDCRFVVEVCDCGSISFR